MSHDEKYLVTSATGNTGNQVALQLLVNGSQGAGYVAHQ